MVLTIEEFVMVVKDNLMEVVVAVWQSRGGKLLVMAEDGFEEIKEFKR